MLAKQNARISLSALLSWRKDVIEAVKVDQTTAANITLRKRVSRPGPGILTCNCLSRQPLPASRCRSA